MWITDGKSVGVLAQQRFRRMPAIWTYHGIGVLGAAR
jgi:hypothetical protein